MAIKTSGMDHIHFNGKNIKRLREVFAQLFEPEITPVALLEPFNFYSSCVSFPAAAAIHAKISVSSKSTATAPGRRFTRHMPFGLPMP